MSFDGEEECPECGCLEAACECESVEYAIEDVEDAEDLEALEEEINDSEVFDLTHTNVQSWTNKDRTVTTIRISDKRGVGDMKEYLVLTAKAHQKAIELGIMDENGERH